MYLSIRSDGIAKNKWDADSTRTFSDRDEPRSLDFMFIKRILIVLRIGLLETDQVDN